MSELRIGANRMVAPTLPLEEFLGLAADTGAVGVELRNDLEGFDVLDALEPAYVTDLLAKFGLEVLSINAVQHFNLPSAVGEATAELKRLIGFARHVGNAAIVMCPHNDTTDSRTRVEMVRDTKATLAQYRPILEDAGIVGLVEPLGFPESSLSDTTVAAEILGEIGSDAFRLTLDTFHFAVAGLDPSLLATEAIPVSRVGLVHLSGVTRSGPIGGFRDPDRVLVDRDDRVGNVATLKRLLDGGYRGAASFEPFSPDVHRMSRVEIERAITRSTEFLVDAVA